MTNYGTLTTEQLWTLLEELELRQELLTKQHDQTCNQYPVETFNEDEEQVITNEELELDNQIGNFIGLLVETEEQIQIINNILDGRQTLDEVYEERRIRE